MAKKDGMPALGAWAYLLGLVIATLAGAFSVTVNSPANGAMLAIVLGVLGLLVGLMNITESEVLNFLIAGVAFLLSVTSLGSLGAVLNVQQVAGIFGNLAAFVAPAVAIVALKAVYDISHK